MKSVVNADLWKHMMWDKVPGGYVRRSITNHKGGHRRAIVLAIRDFWDRGSQEFTNKELAEVTGYSPQKVGQTIATELKHYIAVERIRNMRGFRGDIPKTGWRFTRVVPRSQEHDN